MNIVEYFVRLHLRNKLFAAEERLAALDELISHWESFHLPNYPHRLPYNVVSELANWKSERASLMTRKARLEKELKLEKNKERDV